MEEDWVCVNKVFPTENQAKKVAETISITESRLSSIPRGPQYDIETEVSGSEQGWTIRWRKILIGYDTGCGGCGSCQSEKGLEKKSPSRGKVIQFKPRQE